MNATLNEPSASAAIAGRPLKSNSSQTILYVEDEAALRRLFANVLRESGYRVDVAEDGLAGWEALRLGSYELLITDNEMPRLSGVGLVERMRSAGQALPVIMTSGSFTANDPQRHQWLQMAAILPKPFTAEQLLETIEEVLRTARSVRKRGELFFPVLAEEFARIQPFRHWGINE